MDSKIWGVNGTWIPPEFVGAENKPLSHLKYLLLRFDVLNLPWFELEWKARPLKQPILRLIQLLICLMILAISETKKPKIGCEKGNLHWCMNPVDLKCR